MARGCDVPPERLRGCISVALVEDTNVAAVPRSPKGAVASAVMSAAARYLL